MARFLMFSWEYVRDETGVWRKVNKDWMISNIHLCYNRETVMLSQTEPTGGHSA